MPLSDLSKGDLERWLALQWRGADPDNELSPEDLREFIGRTAAESGEVTSGPTALAPVHYVITSAVSNLSAVTLAQTGYTLADGNSVLLTAQATGHQNRTYDVEDNGDGTGTLTARDTLFVSGVVVIALNGDNGTVWSLKTTGDITAGVTSLTWTADADRYGSAAGTRYAAYWGSESNDGSTPAKAKLYLNSAYAALPSRGGEVVCFSGDGADILRCSSDSTVGFWIAGEHDRQYNDLPTGWLQAKRFVIRGVACGYTKTYGPGAPVARIIGGSTTDPRRPNIWVASYQRGGRFKDVAFTGAAIGAKLGTDSTGGFGIGNNTETLRTTVDICVEDQIADLNACPGELPLTGRNVTVELWDGARLLLPNQGGYTDNKVHTSRDRYLPTATDGLVATASISSGLSPAVTHPALQGGHTLTVGETWLYAGPTAGSTNGGLWTVTANLGGGNLQSTRHTELDSNADFDAGSVLVRIQNGTYAGTVWAWGAIEGPNGPHPTFGAMNLGTTTIRFYQTLAHPENGLYTAADNGDGTFTLTRATDFNTDAELAGGAHVLVRGGYRPGQWATRKRPTGAVLGTTPIEFVRENRLITHEPGACQLFCEAVGIEFDNCTIQNTLNATTCGPGIDLAVHYWCNFNKVTAMSSGSDHVWSICGASVYSDPGGDICSWRNLNMVGAGYYLNLTDAPTYWGGSVFQDIVFEAAGWSTLVAPPAVRIVNPGEAGLQGGSFGSIRLENVRVADAIIPYDVVVEGTANPRNVIIANVRSVSGSCTIENQVVNQTRARTTSLAGDRQVGWQGDEWVGITNAARDTQGAAYVIAANEIDTDIDTWTAGPGQTISSGYSDGRGGMSAYRIHTSGSGADTTKDTTDRIIAEGDYVIFGVRFRGPRNDNPLSLQFKSASASFQLEGASAVYKTTEVKGDGEWTWLVGWAEVTAAAATANAFRMGLHGVNSGTGYHYYADPMVIHCKVEEGWTRNEVARVAMSLNTWSEDAPVGCVAFPRGKQLWLEQSAINTYSPTEPTIDAEAGLGTGGAATVTGTDVAGFISLTTGADAAAGLVATLHLAERMQTWPVCQVMPASDNGWTGNYWASTVSPQRIEVYAADTPVLSDISDLSYHVIGGGRALVTPEAMLGVYARYRADTYEDSGGTRRWLDTSGNNRHIAQATAGRQASLTASAVNSKPAFTFDGTDDIFQSEDAASLWSLLHDGTGCTVIVIHSNGTTGRRLWSTFRGSASTTGALLEYNTGTLRVLMGNSSGSNTMNTSHTEAELSAGWHCSIFEHSADLLPQPVAVSVDNETATNMPYTASPPSVAAPLHTLVVGGALNAALTTPESCFAGSIAEVIILNRTMGSVERGRLFSDYITPWYGITP